MNVPVSNDRLILGAQAVARNLTYNDPQQGAAKHMLHELSHRLGAQTVRIRRNANGWLMSTAFGRTRYLTFKEVVIWCLLKLPPKGAVVE